MSQIALNEDIYIPLYDNGKFKDINIDNFSQKYINGVKCQCTNRYYKTKSSFRDHLKTKVHNDWIENYKFDGIDDPIKKIIELEKVVKNQQMIIIRLENEKSQLINKIELIKPKQIIVENLIEF